jgi:hypothetical protein
MPPYTVRCVKVKKKQIPRASTTIGRMFKGQPARAEKESEAIQPAVTAKVTGPLSYVALLGFAMSTTLFIASLVWGDGMSVLATILLSLLSTLAGIGNKWNLRLAKPASNSTEGDVVIRYPNGSYLVVKCNEEVARELYFAPEEIDYVIKSVAAYRIISLVGTLMLMLGVIALANARLELQFGWAGAYIFINITQWTAAALPARLHWDVSCYEVIEEGTTTGPHNKNFTEALAKAIMFTKSTQWVRIGKAAPQTGVWDEWIRETQEISQGIKERKGKLEDPQWPGANGEEGTLWEVPDSGDAKSRWNALKADHDKEKSAHPARVAAIEEQRVPTQTWKSA